MRLRMLVRFFEIALLFCEVTLLLSEIPLQMLVRFFDSSLSGLVLSVLRMEGVLILKGCVQLTTCGLGACASSSECIKLWRCLRPELFSFWMSVSTLPGSTSCTRYLLPFSFDLGSCGWFCLDGKFGLLFRCLSVVVPTTDLFR